MVKLWVVIPAKDPAGAKTRLASVLTPVERQALSLDLLQRTVRVVSQVTAVSQYLVVSAAVEPLALAERMGALTLQETNEVSEGPVAHRSGEEAPGHTSGERPASAGSDIRRPSAAGVTGETRLNAALQQAAAAAYERGAEAVLVLPADLPLLTATAVAALIHALPEGPGVVLAPDRHRTGTNALLVRPPLAMPFLFGARSFVRHLWAARCRGLPYVMHDQAAISLDLDTPDDLALLATASETQGLVTRTGARAARGADRRPVVEGISGGRAP